MTLDLTPGLDELRRQLVEDRHLATLITTRPGRDQPWVAVVNAAVIDHPLTGEAVVAFVARPGAKLVNVRHHPHATLVTRAGWEWTAVSGAAEVSGPDDDIDGINPSQRRQHLRDIYHAAGGHHPDLDLYDTAMLVERRCAVLIHPHRIWSNPSGSEHLEPQETR